MAKRFASLLAVKPKSNPYQHRSHCVVLGVSHKTCPMMVRERLAFTPDALKAGLESLIKLPGLSETLILSTCNRTEIYAVSQAPEAFRDTLLNWWAETRGLDLADMRPHCYYQTHGDAVSHLFAVTSSIDSMILGEYQILGQVREAFEYARSSGTVGFYLHRLFQQAFATGKKVRESTGIGAGAVSVAYAAVELARQELGDLSRCRAGVVGLGETGILVSRTLHEAGVADLRFFNRTAFKAEIAAKQFGGAGFGLDALAEELPGLDLLVSCTGAPDYVLKPEQLYKCAADSHLLLIDLAVPRDMDPALANRPGCRLFTVDDLQQVVLHNREKRKQSAADARTLIQSAAKEFEDWYLALDVVPLVTNLRAHFQEAASAELLKWQQRMEPAAYAQMQRFSEALVAKLLHEPTVQMRKMAASGEVSGLASLVRRLFALEEKP